MARHSIKRGRHYHNGHARHGQLAPYRIRGRNRRNEAQLAEAEDPDILGDCGINDTDNNDFNNASARVLYLIDCLPQRDFQDGNLYNNNFNKAGIYCFKLRDCLPQSDSQDSNLERSILMGNHDILEYVATLFEEHSWLLCWMFVILLAIWYASGCDAMEICHLVCVLFIIPLLDEL
ncbi:Protein of unknown function [Pyronema omphalodes CBS 100304]|uniref:Uncharacterized protein n=1 Tax=Pyronema omphalodes (strain CBS 100304) TaxID=1076935 RepID=U4LE26_PYROM|nr:Protein of unknown function [Pyronema omphalodes CBS 100304]